MFFEGNGSFEMAAVVIATEKGKTDVIGNSKWCKLRYQSNAFVFCQYFRQIVLVKNLMKW